MRWFLPRNDAFTDLFGLSSANILAGVTLFRDLLDHMDDLPGQVDRIKACEHEGDRITHQTLDQINTTFVTPFDREDIHTLIVRMDDILDAVDAAAARMLIYGVKESTPFLVRFADQLVASAEQVRLAVSVLHDRDRHAEALTACVEINRLENAADSTIREAITELFRGTPDPLQVIKLKDLYVFLEEATDRCEDVANIVETIILKSA
jgi:predicted phosphate transport protein (TIGR00153 family)